MSASFEFDPIYEFDQSFDGGEDDYLIGGYIGRIKMERAKENPDQKVIANLFKALDGPLIKRRDRHREQRERHAKVRAHEADIKNWRFSDEVKYVSGGGEGSTEIRFYLEASYKNLDGLHICIGQFVNFAFCEDEDDDVKDDEKVVCMFLGDEYSDTYCGEYLYMDPFDLTVDLCREKFIEIFAQNAKLVDEFRSLNEHF